MIFFPHNDAIDETVSKKWIIRLIDLISLCILLSYRSMQLDGLYYKERKNLIKNILKIFFLKTLFS